MRDVGAGGVEDAALDGAVDGGAETGVDGCVDGGTLEAGAALLDVPAVGVLDEADDEIGLAVDVLACLGLELHAAAKVAAATRAAARVMDDVSTGLLYVSRSTMRRP